MKQESGRTLKILKRNGLKTADEMFEELGYEKKDDNKFFITYIKRKEYVTYRIVFCIEQKCIEFCNDSDGYFTRFNPEGLKAINKKVKELGWLDE